MLFTKEDAEKICSILNKQREDGEGWFATFDKESQSYSVAHHLGASVRTVSFR